MRNSTIFLLVGLGLIGAFWLGGIWASREKEEDPRETLSTITQKINRDYIKQNGLVESEVNKTTSESQSYGLLMSVINGDKEKFDQIWKWTRENLRVRGDNLFAWRWENGKVVDQHAATDADQDIALALYYANKRWGDEIYLEEAKKIIRDIWNKETKEIAGERYITAGDWVLSENGATLNPSYFAPYAYRIFAQIDPEHNWRELVDSSYFILNKCSTKPGLSPDWCKLDQAGNITINFSMNNRPAGNYSYDALRVPFRIGLDYLLYQEPRALAYLEANRIFSNNWNNGKKIFTVYSASGEPQGEEESSAHYGALLAAYKTFDETKASEILKEKITKVNFQEKSFYDLSWMWFGLIAYFDQWPRN